MSNLKHLSGLILNVPLLCTPEDAETFCAVLGDRIGVDNLGLRAKDSDASQRSSLSLSGDTKVIPVVGSMTHRSTGINAMSGSMLSYAEIQGQIEDAMSDSSVKSILLDIDSGGGQVAGAFDLRDYILDQRGRKPMISIARDTMASAAYLIGSATDKIYTTQTGSVGSIGVVAMHVDQSEKNAKEGIKPTFIHAGEYKTAGNSHGALEGEALSYLQESVNDSYQMFVSAVAEARGMDADAVRATEARMYRGEKAVAQGLADGVASIDVALTELATSAPRVYQSMSLSTNEELLMDPEQIAKLEADLAAATSQNETLRAAVISEGYSITAEGLSRPEAEKMMEVAGVMTAVSSLPEHVVAALTTAKETAEDSALTELASATLPNFGLDAAKSLLKNADADQVEALKAADAALAMTMTEAGSVDVEANMTTSKEKLDAMVADHMSENNLTGGLGKAKATAAVIQTPEGKALETASRKETN